MKMNNKSGVSLIIAIIFVSVLMLLTANLAQVNLAAIKNRANKTLSDRTKDVAEGALELAYSFADEQGVGYNGTLQNAIANADFKKTWDKYIDFFLKPLGLDECTDCIGFRIIGRNEDGAKLKIGGTGSEYFSAPAAYKDENSVTVGTGNAAEKCEKSDDADDADDPCHWNRIYLNDVVEIPLYYVDDSGNTQKLGDTDNFKLRVRAPKCEDPMAPECANERIELYPKVISSKSIYDSHPEYPYNDPKKDKVLIQWLISDLETGETLFANDKLIKNEVNNDEKRLFPKSVDSNDKKFFIGNNTEFSGGRINDANESFLPLNNFIILEENHKSMDLNKDGKEIGKFIESFTKPALRLNMVTQARKRKSMDIGQGYDTDLSNSDLNNIDLFVPYLEYQVLTTNKPIADNKITLFGWAQISDFYKKIKAEKYLPKTEGGFVLGNL